MSGSNASSAGRLRWNVAMSSSAAKRQHTPRWTPEGSNAPAAGRESRTTLSTCSSMNQYRSSSSTSASGARPTVRPLSAVPTSAASASRPSQQSTHVWLCDDRRGCVSVGCDADGGGASDAESCRSCRAAKGWALQVSEVSDSVARTDREESTERWWRARGGPGSLSRSAKNDG